MVVARVLIVDEQAELRAALASGLSRFGFEVVLAAGGADAMAELSRPPGVDAVLSDVGGAANVAELVVEIFRRRPDIPILVYGDAPLLDEFRDDPRVALIQKPAPIAYLAAGVEDLIRAAASGRPRHPA